MSCKPFSATGGMLMTLTGAVLIWIVVEPFLMHMPVLELLRASAIWVDIPFAVWVLSSFRIDRDRRRRT